MNKVNMRKLFLFMLIFSLTTGSGSAQIFKKNSPRNVERQLFGKKSGKRKTIKIREPRAVTKAKKKQEANERKLKKNYAQSIKRSQKRAYQIQTPEVQARMKQNEKNTAARSKAKKKKVKTSTKKAGKKYKQ
jgi:hypothetical protein